MVISRVPDNDVRCREIASGLKLMEESLGAATYGQPFPNTKLKRDECIPQLSWLVERSTDGYDCTVGRSVEVCEGGFFEGIWAGDYDDFSSALGPETYGSGVSFLKDIPEFIQRKDVREYTFILRDNIGQKDYISNSLCFVLARAGIGKADPLLDLLTTSLVLSTFEESKDGFHRMDPFVAGTDRYAFYRVCYANFSFAQDGALRFDKSVEIFDFENWTEYKSYLIDMTKKAFMNAANPKRHFVMTPLTSVSRGYDSPAVSAIAKACGCDQAVTLSVKEDNGAEIARSLGLKPEVVPHIFGKTRGRGLNRHLSDELRPAAFEFIATAGIGDDINALSFEPILMGKLFLSGVGGDGNWQIDAPPNLGMKKTIPQSSSLTEFRLRVGFAHFAPILCGALCTSSIIRISNSEEMKPFRMNNPYDRPIARRFAEESGVDRNSFGMKKMAQNPYFFNRGKVWKQAVLATMIRYQVAD